MPSTTNSTTTTTTTVLSRDQSQWLFTPDEMMRTPSILAGMPVQQELANRQKGVNFITQVGIMLKLPQLTLATAAVYLHRFFMRHAMPVGNKPGLHHYSVAATALFLATKVEENCRKMRELIVACCRVAQKQPNLVVDEQNKEYWKWRDTILHNEDVLLEALCFDLQLEQPYRILFGWMQYYGVESHKVLRNTSWAFLNDSHVTTLCVLYSPRTIAGAALYAGVRLAGITLPDDEQHRPWWEFLGLDILEIQRACNLMFDVYENPHLPRVGQKEAYIREDGTTVFEKTRGDLGLNLSSPHPAGSESGRSVRSILSSQNQRQGSQGSQGTKRDRDDADEWSTAGAAAAAAAAAATSRGPSQKPAGDGQEPLSKKQRRESGDNHNHSHTTQLSSRMPPSAQRRTSGTSPAHHARSSSRSNNNNHNNSGSRIPPSADAEYATEPTIDEVQARIDAIVNRSSSAVGEPEQQQKHHQSRRPLSQRPEQVNDHHHNDSHTKTHSDDNNNNDNGLQEEEGSRLNDTRAQAEGQRPSVEEEKDKEKGQEEDDSNARPEATEPSQSQNGVSSSSSHGIHENHANHANHANRDTHGDRNDRDDGLDDAEKVDYGSEEGEV